MMSSIVMYGTRFCPYCVRARNLLKSLDMPFEDIRVDQQPEKRAEMQALTSGRTVPQIIINGKPIGGSDDLIALHRKGELEPMVNGCDQQ